MDKADIGDRLRIAREQRRITQGELAAKLGVHIMTVTLWENKKNRRNISNKFIYKAAAALKMSVAELIGQDNEQPEPAREMPMIMTQTADEVQWLRMYRLLSERLRLVQFAQLAECVARSNANQPFSHETSIDSAAGQGTIISMMR